MSDKEKTVMLSFRAPETLVHDLRKIAQKNFKTRTGLMTEVLTQWVKLYRQRQDRMKEK